MISSLRPGSSLYGLGGALRARSYSGLWGPAAPLGPVFAYRGEVGVVLDKHRHVADILGGHAAGLGECTHVPQAEMGLARSTLDGLEFVGAGWVHPRDA